MISPFSPPPRNSFAASATSFLTDFFEKKRYQNAQKNMLLQMRPVCNAFETSPFIHPCIAHHYYKWSLAASSFN